MKREELTKRSQRLLQMNNDLTFLLRLEEVRTNMRQDGYIIQMNEERIGMVKQDPISPISKKSSDGIVQIISLPISFAW